MRQHFILQLYIKTQVSPFHTLYWKSEASCVFSYHCWFAVGCFSTLVPMFSSVSQNLSTQMNLFVNNIISLIWQWKVISWRLVHTMCCTLLFHYVARFFCWYAVLIHFINSLKVFCSLSSLMFIPLESSLYLEIPKRKPETKK